MTLFNFNIKSKKMKVKELIEELQKFDPETEVVVDGYETGYDKITELYPVKAFKRENFEKAWYDGDYNYIHKSQHPTFLGSDEKVPGEIIDVVYIPRNS